MFTVPVRINEVLTLDFIVDSGASDVQVPADVVLTLLRTGTISQDDFLPGMTYTLADGSTVKSPRFMVGKLRIGEVEVSKVPASIGGIEGSLLWDSPFCPDSIHGVWITRVINSFLVTC